MTYEPNITQGRDSSARRDSYSGSTREGSGAADQVRQQAQEQAQETLDSTREQAAGGLDSIVDAAAAAADELRDHNQEGLSRYVSEIADSVASVASSIRHKSVDELIHDVEAVARNNPTLFLAGSLAVGLGIGRFARASSKERSSRDADRWAETQQTNSRNYAQNQNDAYFEGAEGYDVQQVTEEDYLADDYAFAAGEDIDMEKEDFGREDLDSTIATRQADITSRQPDITSKQKGSQLTPSNGNQPIGGDFYE